MKRMTLLLLVISLIAGCQKDAKKQALSLASEASLLINEGKHSEAIPLLQKAVRLRPDCAEYHVALAMAYVETQDYPKAKAEYEKALPILRKQAQTDPERVDDLVMVLVCLNRENEARDALDAAKTQFEGNQTIATLTENDDTLVAGFSKWSIRE